jgi:hypothetical protein
MALEWSYMVLCQLYHIRAKVLYGSTDKLYRRTYENT